MSKTKIEWATDTWNPTTGCDRVSPGCDNCYALGMAKRLKAMGQPDYQTDGDPKTSGPGFGIATHPHRLDQPLRWKKPRKVFVNSMSDLFHVGVPVEHLAQVFAVMSKAPQHTFQILTKRHARMRAILNAHWFRALVDDYRGKDAGDFQWPLPNVWLGVSVEDQKWADIRIPALLDTPAAVRFLSCEPLLGPVSLFDSTKIDTGTLVDWVIVGGESGHGARPMHPDWARQLRYECTTYGIPFLFKQWGNWEPLAPVMTRPGDLALHSDGSSIVLGPEIFEGIEFRRRREMYAMRNVGKHAAGRELDGRTWDQYPAVAS